MSNRTGLAAHVPSREWSEKMMAVLKLREAFEHSPLIWYRIVTMDEWVVTESFHDQDSHIHAPLCDEMLAWLKEQLFEYVIGKVGKTLCIKMWSKKHSRYDGYDITDPDALAQACIAAATS